MATTSTFGTTARKAIARLAMIGLDEKSGEILRECFRQFGVSTTPVTDDPSHRFLKEKFEACVLRLDDGAEIILEQVRNSPSNKRIVIYGISKGTQAAMRYSKYGINAVFEEPLERPSVLKVVRSTHLLVINELRRYVRVPIVTEATIEAQNNRIPSSTLEVSAGGMSLICSSNSHSVARLPTYASASSSVTTSPYLASMSKRFASCGSGARSPTHSLMTIVRKPC